MTRHRPIGSPFPCFEVGIGGGGDCVYDQDGNIEVLWVVSCCDDDTSTTIPQISIGVATAVILFGIWWWLRARRHSVPKHPMH